MRSRSPRAGRGSSACARTRSTCRFPVRRRISEAGSIKDKGDYIIRDKEDKANQARGNLPGDDAKRGATDVAPRSTYFSCSSAWIRLMPVLMIDRAFRQTDWSHHFPPVGMHN